MPPSAPGLAELQPGTQIGSYLLTERIGQGGAQAPIWLANEVFEGQKISHAQVVIKFFERPEDPDPVLNEARVLRGLEHPNIVRFYSLLVHGNIMGIVMERVRGYSLERNAHKLSKNRLNARLVAEIGMEISSALVAVHKAGLVHRDIHPGNIVFNSEDSLRSSKLIDFGLSSKLIEFGSLPNQQASVSGRPGFVDPETIQGKHPNASSDLYGLGATLYWCLSGRQPAELESNRRDPDIIFGLAEPPRVAEILKQLSPEEQKLAELIDGLVKRSRSERPSSAEVVHKNLSRILASLSQRAPQLPSEEDGPFRGLGRFEELQRDVFFGRTTEVAASMTRLKERGLLALVGPSGSGKSSLARAGILPALGEMLGGAWDVIDVTPGDKPKQRILDKIREQLQIDHESQPEFVLEALKKYVRDRDRSVLLFVDQMEELVTLQSREEAFWTARLLGEIGNRPIEGVRALVTVRSDLLADLLALDGLKGRLEGGCLLQVKPLEASLLVESISQALGVFQYDFEDETLKRDMENQIKETAEAMPLVQFALFQLWKKRNKESKKITRAAFEELGGIRGALARHADSALEKMGNNYLELTRTVLLELTTAQGTRAPKPRESLVRLATEAGKVVNDLEEARILTSGEGGLTTLAHEVLLVSWGRLNGWVQEVREARQLVQEAINDAVRWKNDRHDDTYLWRGRRLALFSDLKVREQVKLPDNVQIFIESGIRAERRRQRMKWLSISLLMTASLIVTAYMIVAKGEAEKQANVAKKAQTSAQEAAEKADNARKKAVKAQKEADNARDEAVKAQKEADNARDKMNQANEKNQRIVEEVDKAGNDCEKLRAIQKKATHSISTSPSPVGGVFLCFGLPAGQLDVFWPG